MPPAMWTRQRCVTLCAGFPSARAVALRAIAPSLAPVSQASRFASPLDLPSLLPLLGATLSAIAVDRPGALAATAPYPCGV